MDDLLSLYLIVLLVGGLFGLCFFRQSLWTFFFGKLAPDDSPSIEHVEPSRQRLPTPRYLPIFLSDDADIPSQRNPHTVYIIGIKGNEWLAVLTCPCGCESKILLNLLQEERPCWKWRVNDRGEVTLSPSVWRKVGCRSHFVLRDGLISWC